MEELAQVYANALFEVASEQARRCDERHRDAPVTQGARRLDAERPGTDHDSARCVERRRGDVAGVVDPADDVRSPRQRPAEARHVDDARVAECPDLHEIGAEAVGAVGGHDDIVQGDVGTILTCRGGGRRVLRRCRHSRGRSQIDDV